MCEKIEETGAWVVEAKVIERTGACSNDHKVGEVFRFKAKGIEGDLCFSALCGMIPKVYALRYGANIPWTDDADVVFIVAQRETNVLCMNCGVWLLTLTCNRLIECA